MSRRRRKKQTQRLVLAAELGHTTEVRALLRAGADPQTPHPDGTTTLYGASVHGTGNTPLYWASHGSHAETAAVLRAAGASA
ncbi:hypothetical protein [Streptomyces sp. NPDC046925]|uniref:hypothetical protein n=1 Tax=Streptomyces sp. NPDC046925 TaxID=3155375 RepID=UPI0033FE9369